jgi:curved DNA-binding protein CbpA
MITYARLLELAGMKVILTEMSVEQAKNVFKFYGVTPSTDTEELKRQWRQLAIHHHPDKVQGDATAMQEINSAYEILKTSPTNNTSSDGEKIRREPGQAFEDFRDKEYFVRRVASISTSPQPCTAYAFDGSQFTSTVNLNASLDNKTVEMMREGMLTQGGGYTKLIGVIFKSEPSKFYIIWRAKDRGVQKVTYYQLTGFMVNPVNNQKFISDIKNLC